MFNPWVTNGLNNYWNKSWRALNRTSSHNHRNNKKKAEEWLNYTSINHTLFWDNDVVM